ncbi:restriction endonuclease subunit S [Vibrio sp. 10N.286.48.C11]|uniref:restriction endonuclease subunit S n=1 Tax=Vibrio sp. 10N.286.48.C11 TaxID=3229698 RepID=UPI00355460B3
MVPSGWNDGRVGDLVSGLESGVSVNGEDRQLAEGEKGVLKVSAVSYGAFDENAVKAITSGEELKRAKTHPKKGQIIISRSNTEELVGASAYIESNFDSLFLPDKLWQTIPKTNSDMKWLSYVLASEHSRYTLSNLATGTSGSMKNITKGELLGLKVSIPPLPEQRKIAKILSTWDKAIATTEKLIGTSKQQKKALMQQLLTGKKRLRSLPKDGAETGKAFEGEWEEVKLSHLFDRMTEKNKGQSTNVVTISAQHGLIRQQEFFKKSVASETLDNYFILRKGQFAYNKSYSNGYPMGAIKRLNRYEDAVVTSLYICFEIKDEAKTSSCFMEQYFESGLLNRGLTKVAAEGGRAHGLLNVKPSDFMGLSLIVPTFDEQQKIASVLTAADKDIEVIQAKLAHFKQEKKALMQQLLTGKRRVKIDEVEAA